MRKVIIAFFLLFILISLVAFGIGCKKAETKTIDQDIQEISKEIDALDLNLEENLTDTEFQDIGDLL
jgi:outer membrane lipoprotein-sorting protein